MECATLLNNYEPMRFQTPKPTRSGVLADF
jgi:hypothetical protein